MEIRGTTRVVGLLGYPVRHTLSPDMHNAAFQALGLDFCYVALEVRPPDLEAAVRGRSALGIRGVNVTIPHKERIVPLLDRLSAEAEAIGSVNTVEVSEEGLAGYNTDAYGFETAVREDLDLELAGRKVVVLGAGGASRAVSFQAALSGAREIVLTDVEAARSRDLAEAVAARFPEIRVTACEPGDVAGALPAADLLVNATPLGMKPEDPLPLDPAGLAPGTAVFDLVYNPRETRLLKEVRARGLRGACGLGMLVHQGARAFEIFTGREAPVALMRRVVEGRI